MDHSTLPLGEVEPGSFQTMGVGLMATRPRLLNAVRPDRRAVPPCTRRGEVLLIAGSTDASASRPSSISSTVWDFSPSELTPKSQATCNKATSIYRSNKKQLL
jgi:hypothetical protein